MWVTARDTGQLSRTRNVKRGIPEDTAHLCGSYLWVWIEQIWAMTSEEGSLKWIVYDKVLPETIPSRVFRVLWVQADKGAPTSLLFHKGRVEKEREGSFNWYWRSRAKPRGSTSLFLSFSLARALIVLPLNCFWKIIFGVLAQGNGHNPL